MALKITVLITLFIALLSACTRQDSTPVTIAINPWPGYEFLYLAEKKGFFEQNGLNIKLVQLDSLADTQRAYISGRVDGMASTIIEAVQAKPLGGKPLQIILIPDYSNGGDVLISSTEIKSITELKGKTVGCEVTSLGIYLLQRALHKHGLTLEEVNVVNIEQSAGKEAIEKGDIDAFVSYPPESVKLLKNLKFHTIFSSAEIPFEIIDTVAISISKINENPELVPGLHKAWQMSLNYAKENPEKAYQIMAEREGISSEEFKNALNDLTIMDHEDQKSIFAKSENLQSAAIDVCKTLVHVKSLNIDCDTLPKMIYKGRL